jgi:hypothetical protein
MARGEWSTGAAPFASSQYQKQTNGRRRPQALSVEQRKPMDSAELEKVEVLDAKEMAVRTGALTVLDKFSDLLAQSAASQGGKSLNS